MPEGILRYRLRITLQFKGQRKGTNSIIHLAELAGRLF
jgi:hypothetical protein